MQMRVHWIQHAPSDDLGCIAPWLAGRGLTPARTAFYEGDAAPSLDIVDALLIMGGSMNVDETAQHPWLIAEKHFIRAALDAGKPIFGICLGAQLIAEVLGAKVARNPEPEIGWFDVRLDPSARSLAVFTDFPERWPAFHWHGYGYELPAGGVHVASSALCEQQAFALDGGRVLGLQYHPEVTAANVRAWLKDEHLEAAGHVQSPQRMMEALPLFAEANRLTYHLLERWFAAM